VIRFIDLRYQGTGSRFAFRSTVTDNLIEYNACSAWETWADLRGDIEVHGIDVELDRLRGLCPAWVFEQPTEEELEFRAHEPSEAANELLLTCADMARTIGRSAGAYEDFIARNELAGDHRLKEAFRELHESLASAIEARGRG